MGRHHGKGLVTPFSSQHTWFPFYSRANIMLTDSCLLLSFHVLMYLQFSLVLSNFQMQEPYTASYKNAGHDFFILKFIFYWVYSCYCIALIGDSNNCLRDISVFIGSRWGRGVKKSGPCFEFAWPMPKKHITRRWELILPIPQLTRGWPSQKLTCIQS